MLGRLACAALARAPAPWAVLGPAMTRTLCSSSSAAAVDVAVRLADADAAVPASHA
jgi:hypothetical protein